MTYFQYIFSDKKASVYWILIFIVVLILPLFSFITLGHSIIDLGFIDFVNMFLYAIIVLIIYLGFYSSGFLKYRMQRQFINYYNSKIVNLTTDTVEIYQNSLTIKPLRQNFDAKISVKPRFDKYQTCLIDSSLIILGQVYDLGILRRHMRPIQVDLDNNDMDKLKYTTRPKIGMIEFIENDLIIRFEKSINEINELRIIDFKKFDNIKPGVNNV